MHSKFANRTNMYDHKKCLKIFRNGVLKNAEFYADFKLFPVGSKKCSELKL